MYHIGGKYTHEMNVDIHDISNHGSELNCRRLARQISARALGLGFVGKIIVLVTVYYNFYGEIELGGWRYWGCRSKKR